MENSFIKRIKDDRYIIFEYDWLYSFIIPFGIGLIWGVASWIISGSFSFHYILELVLLTLFGFVCISWFKSWDFHSKLSNDVKNELYKLISTVEVEMKKDKDFYPNKDILFYLKVLNNLAGDSLVFDPDNEVINSLHEKKSLISITEANPADWLNPTYSFYLINNYMRNFSWHFNGKWSQPEQLGTKELKEVFIDFAKNRESPDFKKYENAQKQMLQKICDANSSQLIEYLMKDNETIRFYFLTEEELNNNKGIIELLLAGHEQFGCYIYLINNKKIPIWEGDKHCERFQNFLKSIQYDFPVNKDKIDIAVTINDSFEVIYRKGDKLEPREMDEAEIAEFISYIKGLSQKVLNNYEDSDMFFNQRMKSNKDIYKINEEYCYAYLNEVNKVK